MTTSLSDAVNKKNIKTANKQLTHITHGQLLEIVATNNGQRAIHMTNKATSEAYNSAADQLESAIQRLEKAMSTLTECEKSTAEKAKAAIGRAKDSAGQIGDALNRVNRLIGPDFETKLVQLERTALALEKLAELEKTGKLASVINALKG